MGAGAAPRERADEQLGGARAERPATGRSRARKLGWPDLHHAAARRGGGATPSLRVAVVAATRLYRDGLATLLGSHPGLTLVAQDPGGTGAATRIARLPVDVVLLDMSSPDSLATAQRLAARLPAAQIVALAASDTAHRAAYAARGVAACLPHEAGLEEVVDTLTRLVAAGDRGNPAVSPVADRRLTTRELQVIGLVNEGLSNKEIAEALGIAVATVKNHVHHALAKLRLRRRGEAAAWLRAGGTRTPTPA